MRHEARENVSLYSYVHTKTSNSHSSPSQAIHLGLRHVFFGNERNNPRKMIHSFDRIQEKWKSVVWPCMRQTCERVCTSAAFFRMNKYGKGFLIFFVCFTRYLVAMFVTEQICCVCVCVCCGCDAVVRCLCSIVWMDNFCFHRCALSSLPTSAAVVNIDRSPLLLSNNGQRDSERQREKERWNEMMRNHFIIIITISSLASDWYFPTVPISSGFRIMQFTYAEFTMLICGGVVEFLFCFLFLCLPIFLLLANFHVFTHICGRRWYLRKLCLRFVRVSCIYTCSSITYICLMQNIFTVIQYR